ncbi:fimbrial protein [Aquitalea sp. FJL05]|uniref:fimbrial protein n=1 Tax=Aquitalea sp. FJL05 TaxID=2153366 RepID=UPI001315760D|nr:fimbrial protein [Aquitalea sp. FJL05]
MKLPLFSLPHRWLFSVLLFCLSPITSAYCSASGNGLLNFTPLINIGRDLPIGTILASAKISTAVTCDSHGFVGLDASWRAYPSKNNVDYGASSVTNVRNTTTPGIGIRWDNLSSATGSTAIWTQYPLNNIPLGVGRGLPTPPSPPATMTTTFTDTIYLVKTGPISSGTISPIALLTDYEGSISYAKQGLLYSLSTPTAPSFQVNTCTVSSSALNVTLPAIYNNAMPSPGDIAGNTPFNIPVNCPQTTKLYITFTDSNNPGQTGNMLSLQSGATASGLALQIKQNGQAVSFGPDSNVLGNTNQLLIGNTTGSILLPFSVNYIRTANGPLIAGKLTALASFTFSYQ